MAQHAVPKGIGHNELRRAQLITKSTFVVRKVGVPDPNARTVAPLPVGAEPPVA
jgi:hypothetical protein